MFVHFTFKTSYLVNRSDKTLISVLTTNKKVAEHLAGLFLLRFLKIESKIFSPATSSVMDDLSTVLTFNLQIFIVV